MSQNEDKCDSRVIVLLTRSSLVCHQAADVHVCVRHLHGARRPARPTRSHARPAADSGWNDYRRPTTATRDAAVCTRAEEWGGGGAVNVIIIIIIILYDRNGNFLRGCLPRRGEAQMACNLLLPREDNILNKFVILERMTYYSDELTVPMAWLD